MTTFTPYPSLLGGALVGLSAVIMLGFLGRITGISGILSGLLPPNYAVDKSWRIAFLAGLISAFFFIQGLTLATIPFEPIPDKTLLLMSGLIVGIGVTLSSGCTSGHGVCGLARLSKRSIISTLTFMITTTVTVYLIQHIV